MRKPSKTFQRISPLLLLCAWFSGVAQEKPAEPLKAIASPTPSGDDRQKALQADMDRLLRLATQLKVEVDGSRKDELSVKVIRDADEIDKLARSARGRIGR